MGDQSIVLKKVARWMDDLDLKYLRPRHEMFELRFGSALVRLYVTGGDEDGTERPTFVKFLIPVLDGVTDSPELNEYIAYHADDYILGHLSLFRTDKGEIRIFFTHNLLGDYLDFEEFNAALGAASHIVDKIDDELQPRFGGTRSFED